MTNGLGATGLCVWHDPDRADKASRMRRHGANAANARRRQGLDPDELGPLETVEDCKRWIRVLAVAASSGRLGVSAAEVSIRGVRAWLQADKAVSDEQLRALEDQIRELKSGPLRRVK